MALVPLSDVLLGLYLGLLTGIFPAFIAFALGYVFRYFTNVTVPGFGVVVLGGALAGISGGLLGVVDPQLAGGWTGITAILVVLMLCLWAHAQGDRLATATPRRLGFNLWKEARVTESLADLVDAYGQVRIRPLGEVGDLEGYPPLPEDIRQEIQNGSWRLPANLAPAELEARLEERLITDHNLAEATVRLDRKGLVEIQAAPLTGGLSRRVPKGQRAVSVKALLPTGMAKGDIATLVLPGGEVTGTVLSARTDPAPTDTPETPSTAEPPESAPPAPAAPPATDGTEAPPRPPKTPTTTGGEGQVTVAVATDATKRVLQVPWAPLHVQPRGKQREFQVLSLLKDAGNRFRKIKLPEGHPLVGETLATARVRERFDVAVLAIRRPTERRVAPTGGVELRADDTLTVVGRPEALDRFEQEVAA